MELATLSPQDLRSSTAPSSSESASLQRLKAGRDAAKTILCRFPDYGKAPPEYLAGIAELLASFDADVLRTMTDPRIGISARCKFLPTQADIVEVAEALEARRHATRDLRQGRVPEQVYQRKPMPFPKLWAAFHSEPTLLDRNFDTLADASRALAQHGREAAEGILKRGKDAMR